MRVRVSRLAACVVVLLSVASPALAADAEHGKALFAPCAACHTDRTDALGPNLKGVFGSSWVWLLALITLTVDRTS